MRHLQIRPLAKKLDRKVLGVRGLFLLPALLAGACGGYPDGLVVVHVNGLIASISELSVTMQLDGTQATNPKATTGTQPMTFLVYDDMTRFGIQVPSGTHSVGLSVTGYDTALDKLRIGATTLDLSQGKDFAVTLNPYTP